MTMHQHIQQCSIRVLKDDIPWPIEQAMKKWSEMNLKEVLEKVEAYSTMEMEIYGEGNYTFQDLLNDLSIKAHIKYRARHKKSPVVF